MAETCQQANAGVRKATIEMLWHPVTVRRLRGLKEGKDQQKRSRMWSDQKTVNDFHHVELSFDNPYTSSSLTHRVLNTGSLTLLYYSVFILCVLCIFSFSGSIQYVHHC